MNDLVIGIILGLGLPYLAIMAIVLRRCFCPTACGKGGWMCRNHDAESLVRLELSPQAYEDFIRGRMTVKLHHEISHLYALKGDLSAYTHVAQRLKHAYLIEFLKDPARHPTVLHAQVRNAGNGKMDNANAATLDESISVAV